MPYKSLPDTFLGDIFLKRVLNTKEKIYEISSYLSLPKRKFFEKVQSLEVYAKRVFCLKLALRDPTIVAVSELKP